MSETQTDMIHYKRVASLIGASEKSVAQAFRDGRFEMTDSKENAAGIPMYYVSENDPVLREIISSLETGEGLPEWLSDRKKKKGRPKDAEPTDEHTPKVVEIGSGPNVAELRRGATRMDKQYGKKTGIKTKIYRHLEDSGGRSFTTWRPGIVDPEELQNLFPKGGGFYLVVYRMLSNGEWEYVPNLSRDDEPVWVDPKPGVSEDDVEPGTVQPADDPNAAFVRKTAEKAWDDRWKPGQDGGNGTAQAIAQMQGNVTNILSGMISANNNTFQQMMAMSQRNHESMMETISKREEAREKERAHEAKMAEEAHRKEMDRLRAEQDAREKEREAEHRRRMEEVERKHELEAQRYKNEQEERSRRDKEWLAEMQNSRDQLLAKIHQMDTDSRTSMEKRVEETIANHERFFEETQRHLSEEFQLRQSMMPSQIWADAIRDIGKTVSSKLPSNFLEQIHQGTVSSGMASGDVEPKTRPESGDAKMGANILTQLKQDPQSKAMLKEILEDMAKFIEEDEPASFFAQKILGMVTTVPGFSLALTEIYMTPLAEVLKNVIDPDSETAKTILSDKGAEFWKTFRAYVKNYYVQMQQMEQEEKKE